ncbi:MAG: hypothetical protein ACFCGT_13370 [Sandaracinaceae bacterium]
MPRAPTRRLAPLVTVVALAALSSSCSPYRYQTGYATYYIEFYDYVIDWTGQTQRALCADYVTFLGDLDTACYPYPMVYSYGQYAWMTCTYIDSQGFARTYRDYYYFTPGYIREPSCPSFPQSYEAPPPETDEPELLSQSVQPRDEEAGLALAPVQLPDGIDIEDGEPSLAELRGLLPGLLSRLRTTPPEDRPARIPVGEPFLGDPPGEP